MELQNEESTGVKPCKKNYGDVVHSEQLSLCMFCFQGVMTKVYKGVKGEPVSELSYIYRFDSNSYMGRKQNRSLVTVSASRGRQGLRDIQETPLISKRSLRTLPRYSAVLFFLPKFYYCR